MATNFELISDIDLHAHRFFADATMRNGLEESARKELFFYRSQGAGGSKKLVSTQVKQTGDGQHKHWVTLYIYSDGSTSTYDGMLWSHTPATSQ